MVDLLLDLFLQVFLLHYFPLTQGYFLLVLLAALVQFLSFLELKKRHAMEGLHRMFDKALIDHIVINVKSRTAMINFYCNVLGFSVERNIPAMTQLKLGSILIDLLEMESVDFKYGANKNIDHFCLRVSPFDCDDIIKHFKRVVFVTRSQTADMAHQVLEPRYIFMMLRTIRSS